MRFQPTWRSVFLTAGLWAVVMFGLLPRFPTVYVDEAENANHAYNLVTHGTAVFSLYDDLYPEKLSYLRHAWPVVIRPFFVYPLAAWLYAAGMGLVNLRLFSLVSGFLCLLMVYALGSALADRRLGFLAMAILATRFVFLYCSARIRPEMVLCLCGLLIGWCLLIAPRSKRSGWTILAGLLAGLSVGIHTNGVVFLFAGPVWLVFQKRFKSLGLFVAGATVGVAAFALSADWARFLPGVRALMFQEFSAPSILRYHGNIFAAFGAEFERYLGTWDFHDWSGGRMFHLLTALQYALYVAAVAWGCLRGQAGRGTAQFAALLALGYALFVGQKAFPYISVMEPFFVLCLAGWLLSQPVPSRPLLMQSAGLVFAGLPIWRLPLAWTLPLSVLPKKKFQIAILILLLALFVRSGDLRIGFGEVAHDMRRLWFLPVVGISLYVLWCGRFNRRLTAISTAWAALILTTAGTIIFVGAVAAYRPSFNTLAKRFEKQIPAGQRVAGPQIFWLAMHTYEYRDIGALGWHRLLLGEKDLTRPLARWKPEYLIVSTSLVRQIARLNAQRHVKGRAPTGLFPWAHDVLDVVDVGRLYGGELALIRNHWPDRPHR